VEEGYRDELGVGTETIASIAGQATVVRWPSVYWAGYFPDLFYMRDAAGQPVVDGPFDYHDRVILQAFAMGCDVAQTRRVLEDPERPSDAVDWASKATAELDIRGQGCDVQVAEFIASKFRDELLFFTMNHPAGLLLAFISQQVLELIGLPNDVQPELILTEMLGSTFYPLHVNHVRTLGLGFGDEVAAGRVPFRIRDVSYESDEAVRAFFNYYQENRDLVGINTTPRP
jgi:hypothetical protein